MERSSDEFDIFLRKKEELCYDRKKLQRTLLSIKSDNLDLSLIESPSSVISISSILNENYLNFSEIEIKEIIQGECTLFKSMKNQGPPPSPMIQNNSATPPQGHPGGLNQSHTMYRMPQQGPSMGYPMPQHSPVYENVNNDTPNSHDTDLDLDYAFKNNLSGTENNAKQLQEIFNSRKMNIEEEFTGIRFSSNLLELNSNDNSQLCHNIMEIKNSLDNLKQFYEDAEVIKEKKKYNEIEQLNPSRSKEIEFTNNAINEIIIEMERFFASSR